MLEGLHCLRCDANWSPRVAAPKVCPVCHSPYWNKARGGQRIIRMTHHQRDPVLAPDGTMIHATKAQRRYWERVHQMVTWAMEDRRLNGLPWALDFQRYADELGEWTWCRLRMGHTPCAILPMSDAEIESDEGRRGLVAELMVACQAPSLSSIPELGNKRYPSPEYLEALPL